MLPEDAEWPRAGVQPAPATSRHHAMVAEIRGCKQHRHHEQVGKENLADFGTKHMDFSMMYRFMDRSGFKFSSGQYALALKAEVQVLDIEHHVLDENDVDCIEGLHAEHQHHSTERRRERRLSLQPAAVTRSVGK